MRGAVAFAIFLLICSAGAQNMGFSAQDVTTPSAGTQIKLDTAGGVSFNRFHIQTYTNGIASAAAMTDAASGGSATTTYVAGKRVAPNQYKVAVLESGTVSNGQIKGATDTLTFSTTAATSTDIKQAAVSSSASIVSELGTSGNLATRWANPSAVGTAPTVTAMTVRIYNRAANQVYAISRTTNNTQTGTTFTFSPVSAISTSLGASSHMDVTCDPATGETGGVLTFTASQTSFTLKCRYNGANKQMDVNWGTIPATNNFYVNPFQIQSNVEQSLGFYPNSIRAIGVFTPISTQILTQGVSDLNNYHHRWMALSNHFLNSRKLYEIILPGSTLSSTDNFGNDLSLLYFFGAQLHTITQQLEAGARALHLNLYQTGTNYYSSYKQFPVGATSNEEVSVLLADVNTFITTNTGQIVVIVVESMTVASGSTENKAAAAAKFTTDTNAASKLIPKASKDFTYQQLIAVASKRIVVSFFDQTIVDAGTLLWDPVTVRRSTATDPAGVITAVQAALNWPKQLDMAEYSLRDSRKDTTRSWFAYDVERSMASAFNSMSLVCVDFYHTDNNFLAQQAVTYNWVRATTSPSSAVLALPSLVVAGALLLGLLLPGFN